MIGKIGKKTMRKRKTGKQSKTQGSQPNNEPVAKKGKITKECSIFL
jgi:hypothetical protein